MAPQSSTSNQLIINEKESINTIVKTETTNSIIKTGKSSLLFPKFVFRKFSYSLYSLLLL